jgi:sec-independent protein translocase protein TatB
VFDVSFSELTVVGVVALVVLGPEKLPKIAKSAGEWMGKAQRYVNEVKGQINRELEQSELKKVQDSLQTAASDFNKELSTLENEIAPLQVDVPADPYGYSSRPTHYSPSWRPRKKKLSHRKTTIPRWYKQLHNQRTRILSGAARMQKHKKY